MNCAVHSNVEATGFCRNCGKALCPECTRDVGGALYCEPCLLRRVRTRGWPCSSDLFRDWEPCTTRSI